jgi:hypothetical protein
MNNTQTNDITPVSIEENNLLTVEYSKEEVIKVIYQMEHNKALGRFGWFLT